MYRYWCFVITEAAVVHAFSSFFVSDSYENDVARTINNIMGKIKENLQQYNIYEHVSK